MCAVEGQDQEKIISNRRQLSSRQSPEQLFRRSRIYLLKFRKMFKFTVAVLLCSVVASCLAQTPSSSRGQGKNCV